MALGIVQYTLVAQKGHDSEKLNVTTSQGHLHFQTHGLPEGEFLQHQIPDSSMLLPARQHHQVTHEIIQLQNLTHRKSK